ncbi:MAG TPA: hypothetical protein VIF59_03335 [Methylomirabilota bacterium]
MIGRSGLLLLLLIASTVPVGCSNEWQRQWVRPGGEYTTAEFRRDRDACTKSSGLDEQCMKEKGWVPITADRAKDPPPAATPNVRQTPRGSRY